MPLESDYLVQNTVTITRNELKDVKSLRTRKGRTRLGQFTAEGVRLLEEALRFDVMPETVYTAMSVLSERAEQLVSGLQAKHVNIVSVRRRDLDAMADTDSPQGVVAVFERPTTSLGQLYHEGIRKIVWCPDIADPGNLGTIARAALAFGFDLLVVGADAVDPYSPKVVRSSAGAVLGLPAAEANVEEVLQLVDNTGMELIVADAHGETELQHLVAPGDNPLILTLGSEAHGIEPRIAHKATTRVHIPHTSRVESLNVAIAGGILMQRLYG